MRPQTTTEQQTKKQRIRNEREGERGRVESERRGRVREKERRGGVGGGSVNEGRGEARK